MPVKVYRRFIGGYIPNNDVLAEKNVIVRPIRAHTAMVVANANQGAGRIKGTTRKVGNNYSPVPVCVFRRDNRQLLWEIKSKLDGSYDFRNIAVGLECFVVAFDPNDEFNAVISDKVIAK